MARRPKVICGCVVVVTKLDRCNLLIGGIRSHPPVGRCNCSCNKRQPRPVPHSGLSSANIFYAETRSQEARKNPHLVLPVWEIFQITTTPPIIACTRTSQSGYCKSHISTPSPLPSHFILHRALFSSRVKSQPSRRHSMCYECDCILYLVDHDQLATKPLEF